MGCGSSSSSDQTSPAANAPKELSTTESRPKETVTPALPKSDGVKEVRTENMVETIERTNGGLPSEPEPEQESEQEPQSESQKESESKPSLVQEPFIVTAPPPVAELESDDDGSELSRDSFEGKIVTNTPSPALAAQSDDGVSSIASSSQRYSMEKVVTKEKSVTVISSKEEFIFEYERWQPFVQWGQSNPGHILPSDPGMYKLPSSSLPFPRRPCLRPSFPSLPRLCISLPSSALQIQRS
jgi:hypothetical protein